MKKIALVVALAIAANALSAPAYAAVPKTIAKPKAVPSTPGKYVRPGAAVTDPTADKNMRSAPAVTWPSATVSKAAASITVSSADVRTEVVDRSKTAGRPLVVKLSRSDGAKAAGGSTRVTIDTSGFRDAYGGDWAGRLRLVSLPECALTTPDAAKCAQTDLVTTRDASGAALSATVPLAAGAMVALASGPQSTGGGGDYSATALSPTSSWSAGGQSGDFSWSYPMATPNAFGGPSPSVGLSYSSQSLDGKTAASNSQPSWIGDGFDYSSGAISRIYPACADDGKTGIGDLCWGTDNATISLPGHAGELIQVSTSPDVWKLKNDDGTRVERLTGASNGARNGEYWKVSTTDGWEYWFGLNQLPGWSTGKATTQSVYTVPVFGNNAGEPCYNATFASAWCTQAYSWNLDYVVDPHNNSESFWYAPEANNYARNVTASSVSTYTRGGHLDRIEYGTRREGGVDSTYSVGAAPARVLFGVQDRCVTQGATCTSSTPSNWPDVPWDMQCTSTSSCPTVFAPGFFTQKMLSTVTTQVWTGTGTDYRDVQRWTLDHVFKDPGDGRAKTLWLNGVSVTGLNGTPVTTPGVSFTGVQLGNRVDKVATKDPIIRFRISSVVNEAGGVVAVTYSQPECVLGSNMPAAADSNTKRCYPVWWTPYGGTAATFDWFHKYVVTGVTVADPTGHNATQVSTYSYDTPAWHADDSELVPANHRSWGQWRGYSRVRTVTGAADSNQQQTDSIYFRGMNGDKTSSGTRTVTIPADPDFGGDAIADDNWLYGQTRETIVYNGVGDSAPVLSKTLTTPWAHGPTVTRTRNGITTSAYVVNTKSSTSKTALDASRGWRTTTSTNTFDFDAGTADPIGRIVKTEDLNDVSTAADDRCTTTTYATDPAGKIRNAVAEQRKVAVNCSTTPNLATDVVSDTRTLYDHATTFDQKVTLGEVTQSEQLADVTGGTPRYIAKNKATYDKYGRVLTSKDSLGYETTTEYTPKAGSLPTGVLTTNAKGWISSSTLDPAYGNPISKLEPDGSRTDLEYDALGRLTKVWQPGRDKATQSPSEQYTYVLGGTAQASSVATATLNTDGTGYHTTYQVYDGQLRPRQTQTPAPGGGVILTDTLYDSRGLAVQANDSYFQAGVSWGQLFVPSSPTPGRTLTSYDHAGRASDVIFQANGVEKWRTTTTFHGDHTDASAPPGGTATTTWMSAIGQITKHVQYHSNLPAGDTAVTNYEFDKRGNSSKITDPMGSVWTFVYDLRGRLISTDDADRGATTYTYDDADQQLTVTDARNIVRTNVYDELGRVTERWQGPKDTGTLLSRTTFDTLRKGQQTASTRYAADGAQYTSSIGGYDAAGQVTSASVTIPASEGLLAGTYTTTTQYNANGSVKSATLPKIGDLPQETIQSGYNSLGLPTTLSGLNTYVTGTAYDSLGRLSTTVFADGGGKELAQLYGYDAATGRLAEHGVFDNKSGAVFQDEYPEYDAAGNVLSIKDKTAQYGAGPDDNQCFRYDYYSRLTEAFTPADGNCAATNPVLGGPAPYWQTWKYYENGDRLSQTDHVSGGTTTATSTYPAATADQPHAQTKVDYTGVGGSKTDTYTYDEAGNMTGRNLAGKPAQTLTWDAEGHLAKVKDTNGTTSYVYDAGGSRLIARDSTGATLYLGAQQLHVSTANQVAATRYYGSGAVRTTANGLCWLTSDQHGTNNLTFKAATLAKTQRRTTPFGSARDSTTSWVTDRGFVGGYADPTGLTQLGARPYDTSLGRFVSVDPQFDSGDPQSFNGYAYSHNNPVTNSDPSGLSDTFFVYLGSSFGSFTSGGYRYYYEKDYYKLCRSDGACLYYGDALVVFVDFYLLFRVKIPVKMTYGPLAAPKPVIPLDRCITPPPPPPPPPSCGFWDFKCGVKHPGWWWSGNKGWVQGAVAVAGVGVCVFTAGAGCVIAGAVGAGISMADRTYDFVHNEKYNDGAAAWGEFALGTGIDALGMIPAIKGMGATAPALFREGDGIMRNGERIIMSRPNVEAIADKYGMNMKGVGYTIDKVRQGPPGKPLYGLTRPDGRITLFRDAFVDEEQLARTIAHERFHRDELRRGLPFPRTEQARRPYEDRAYAFEEAWWQANKHLL
ncbi:RHS repeat domain-containing protein [Paractinoplanes toevensis]|uniref:Teneurin-like YD-shell domain-containing protein n=1 Tax=Paractinoplanes toevensis TaxID=571911 RepID=A0A919T753_9ACTN|nr:RHS repeat-associated core domain-containing protein [Actinoplanes toevensis]GIM89932.1 hypothetical protein Ato02nite_017250 [Actinoplanes toevensis]